MTSHSPLAEEAQSILLEWLSTLRHNRTRLLPKSQLNLRPTVERSGWCRPLRSSAPVPVALGRFRASVSRALFGVLALSCTLGWLGTRIQAAVDSSWTPGTGYRWRPLTPISSETNHPGFTRLPSSRTGLAFTNNLPEHRHLTNQILLNGAGLAAGDIDGDSLCDLYFCASDGSNALFRNLGNWTFQAVPNAGGADCAGLTSTGAAFADLNGDGHLDLVVNTLAKGTRVFFNNGRGDFRPSGTTLNDGRAGMSLALADINGDGFLDLYVANYRSIALMDMPSARATFRSVDGRNELETFNGRPVTEPDLKDRFRIGPRGEIEEQGEPDSLYLNQNGHQFAPVPYDSGAFLDENGEPLRDAPLDWGLSAMFRDLNQDSLPDLYVCNDFQTEDRLWINQGQGRFRLVPRLSLRRTSLFSMAVDFADINRDGWDDFFVADMMSREHAQQMRYVGDAPPMPDIVRALTGRPQYGQNMLFLNRGDMTFAEIAQYATVQASEWSWSCIFLDVDLDGLEDLLVSNGMERAARDRDVVERLKAFRTARRRSDAEVFEARRMFPRLATPNLAFRNRGNLKFEETGSAWGFNANTISQAMALADLDNDGDLDVLINNLNSTAGVYQNNATQPRLAIRLNGQPPNTRGIGARIVVRNGAVPLQSQEMLAGGRYLAGDDPVRVFAAGTPTNLMTIEITWRNGNVSRITDARADRLYQIDEASAVPRAPGSSGPASDPWFEDVSNTLRHQHHEEPFDEFARQMLLPHRLSTLGPGVGWIDLDGDDADELVVATGKGGRIAGYRFREGQWEALETAPFDTVATRDILGIAAWPWQTNRTGLVISFSNYEDALAHGESIRVAFGDQRTDLSWPATTASPGPVAVADIDNDGDLDVFVGVRVQPGKYPIPAPSFILRNDGGKLVLDSQNAQTLGAVGLVAGAVFTDIDQDGDPDLVLACDWGPIRLLVNHSGVFRDASASWGLDRFVGWWNGVVAGDFNADGNMDIAASNWGGNTKYEVYRPHPLLLYAGDLNQDGFLDLIEAHFDPTMGKTVPERPLDEMARALPFLRERFQTHRAYSAASLDQVLGDRLPSATLFQAHWLENTVFLQRSNRFEALALPPEAQLAPAFGICAADADGDGFEDLFLAQNFFAVQPGTARLDAGRGLWLRGDGRGAFTPLSTIQSGIAAYGEQRGAAVGDFDRDGRIDLVLAQNNESTKLYRNRSAIPGLRVTLHGPQGNPRAVGATIRLKFEDRFGPIRGLHAGSGYGSQDSLAAILATPTPPEAIQVRWPGGRTTTNTIPTGARFVTVNSDGQLFNRAP